MDNFDREIRDLPILLHRAREALTSQFRHIFLLHDLTDPQWRVLRILQNTPGIDATQLAQRSLLLGPSLSRIVRDLTSRGLIERTTDARDARRSLHDLTDAGRLVIEEVSPYFQPIYDNLKQQLGECRTIDVNNTLRLLLDALGYDSHTGAEAADLAEGAVKADSSPPRAR